MKQSKSSSSQVQIMTVKLESSNYVKKKELNV